MASSLPARAEVSVLCYHNFSADKEATEMRIETRAFAAQMSQIKKSGIKVLTLQEFLDWKKGELQLPAQNILITIDDGWRSVYTEAFPILKSHQFPFVLGLYQDFVGKGELALSSEMIREMLGHQMTIVSHSVSHPFPSEIKAKKAEGPAALTALLSRELGESKRYFEKTFGASILTYIYPGGYYTREMFPVLRSFQYETAFTVLPGKVTRDSSDLELPRYVVLGTTDRLFRQAMTFSVGSGRVEQSLLAPAHPVQPANGERVSNRFPLLSADLSGVVNLDKESVYMRVSGYGKVPAQFAPETSRFEWQVPRALRAPSHTVMVQWRLRGKSKYEDSLKWTFSLNHQPAYLQQLAE